MASDIVFASKNIIQGCNNKIESHIHVIFKRKSIHYQHSSFNMEDYSFIKIAPYISICFGILLIVFYVSTFTPIIIHRNRYKNSYYLLLLAISLADVCSILFDQILFTPVCSLRQKCPGPPIVNKILSAISFWQVYFIYLCHFLVALNGVCAVFFWSSVKVIFSYRKTLIYVGIASVLAVLWDAPWVAGGLEVDVNYMDELFAQPEPAYADWFVKGDMACDIGLLTITFLLYGITFLKLK